MSFFQAVGSLDKTDPAPLYMQIKKRVREAITNRAFETDDAIPAERELATEMNVSRLTIRKAIDGLVAEGLLTRRRGAGTFIANRVEKSFSKLSSFTEDMISRGLRPHSKWLSKSEGSVTPEEALSLSLSPGTLVYRFQRIRYANDLTMALEYSTIPSYCLKSLDAVQESLYAALEHTGNRPVRALQRLRAVLFNSEQADILGINVRDAGLFIERRGFLADGRTAEFTQSYYRGDAYDLVAELNDV